MATFCHYDHRGVDGDANAYALIQSSAGVTYLNNKEAQLGPYIRRNNSTLMVWDYHADGEYAAGSDHGTGAQMRTGLKIVKNGSSHFYTDDFALQVRHDGNTSDKKGIIILCGTDDSGSGWGAGTAIRISDGDGHTVGDVTFAAGTVTYGAFTGGHPAKIIHPELVPHHVETNTGHNDNDVRPDVITAYKPGTLVKIISTETTGLMVHYNVTETTVAYDKSVMGVYHHGNIDHEAPDLHNIASLGDGIVLVCPEGGDIEIGDYLCSSSTAGHAMKQDDDLLHNYTVAKATEAVKWSEQSLESITISCTYHSA